MDDGEPKTFFRKYTLPTQTVIQEIEKLEKVSGGTLSVPDAARGFSPDEARDVFLGSMTNMVKEQVAISENKATTQ